MTFTAMVVLGRGLGSSNYYVSEGVTRAMTETYFIPDRSILGLTAAEKSLMEIDQYFEIYDYINQVVIQNVLNDKNPAIQEITNSTDLHLTAGQNKVK